jgi:hypothetical protein
MADLPVLRYLFRAEFADGYVIEQTSEDISALPEGGSAFRDVERYESPLKTFSLIGQGNTWMLDLHDRVFYLNGNAFAISNPEQWLTDLKIVYKRRRKEAKTGIIEQPSQILFYMMGYEGLDPRSQQVIEHLIYIP